MAIPPKNIQDARVPGSELVKRVFYESVTGFSQARHEGCPYGCTVTETAQGPYILDHVKRVAYPYTAPQQQRGSSSSGSSSGNSSTANVAAIATAVADVERRNGLAMLAVRRAHEDEVARVRRDLAAATGKQLEQDATRKEEIQALQRKLTMLHKEVERGARQLADTQAQLQRRVQQQVSLAASEKRAEAATLERQQEREQELQLQQQQNQIQLQEQQLLLRRQQRLEEKEMEKEEEKGREGGDRGDTQQLKRGRSSERDDNRRTWQQRHYGELEVQREALRALAAEDKHRRTVAYNDARIGVASSSSSSSAASSRSPSSSSLSSSSSSSSSWKPGSSRDSAERAKAVGINDNTNDATATEDTTPVGEKEDGKSNVAATAEEDREASLDRRRRESYRSHHTRRGAAPVAAQQEEEEEEGGADRDPTAPSPPLRPVPSPPPPPHSTASNEEGPADDKPWQTDLLDSFKAQQYGQMNPVTAHHHHHQQQQQDTTVATTTTTTTTAAPPSPSLSSKSKRSSSSGGAKEESRVNINSSTSAATAASDEVAVAVAAVAVASKRITAPVAADDDNGGSSDEVQAVGLKHNVAPPRLTSVIRSRATLPNALVGKYRNAVLFCHLCRIFFAPHPVNLRQHVLSAGHQATCATVDDFIDHSVDSGSGGGGGGDASAWRSDKESHRLKAFDAYVKSGGTSIADLNESCRTQFGKLCQYVPAFIGEKSIVSDEERAEVQQVGNSFFDEGFDIVLSMCDICNEPVTTQSYKVHESSTGHRSKASRQ